MSTKMDDDDWAHTLAVFRACLPRRGRKAEDDRRFLEALHLADHRPEGSPGDRSRGREGGVCARRLLVRRSLYGGCRVESAIEQVGKAASGRLSFFGEERR